MNKSRLHKKGWIIKRSSNHQVGGREEIMASVPERRFRGSRTDTQTCSNVFKNIRIRSSEIHSHTLFCNKGCLGPLSIIIWSQTENRNDPKDWSLLKHKSVLCDWHCVFRRSLFDRKQIEFGKNVKKIKRRDELIYAPLYGWNTVYINGEKSRLFSPLDVITLWRYGINMLMRNKNQSIISTKYKTKKFKFTA